MNKENLGGIKMKKKYLLFFAFLLIGVLMFGAPTVAQACTVSNRTTQFTCNNTGVLNPINTREVGGTLTVTSSITGGISAWRFNFTGPNANGVNVHHEGLGATINSTGTSANERVTISTSRFFYRNGRPASEFRINVIARSQS